MNESVKLYVDASRMAAASKSDVLSLGSSTSPDGETIGINSRYLTRAGKPWLPVMGELHYARVPALQWDDALAKVKAAGVDIVAFYVIWRYHESGAGHFDWQERRDLRRFVQACERHGLLACARIGPWVHGELRYGGLPDWVVAQMRTRGDDPVYLSYVQRFFVEVATQLRGMLWKDGGPVIGIQLENEYNLTGPGQGAAHIGTLKQLARRAGLDTPLYTVTGWDNAVFPHGDVTPVFGGYPDVPWGASTGMSPPNEVYGFRFTSRVGGDLGAQTHRSEPGDAEAVSMQTPFLGAEFGGGVPTMYRRRPVLDPDDIAAMLPVQLGSGVNLYGYYMLYGGRNPPGDMSGQESTASGGYNDLPIVNYDFQAPFGANGEPHASLGKLRLLHLFLRQWGSALAPCEVFAPEVVPHGCADLITPRFAVRADGDRGFLFFNNHVRQHATPAHEGVQFSVKLSTGAVVLPHRPIDIASGSWFVWPIGLTLGAARLCYATAQPVTQLKTAEGETCLFAATDGITPEYAFDAASVRGVTGLDLTGDAQEPQLLNTDGVLIARTAAGSSMIVTAVDGSRITIITMARADAEKSSVLQVGGQQRLVVTDALAFERDGQLVLRSIGSASFSLAVYPPLAHTPRASVPLAPATNEGLFQKFHVFAAPVEFDAQVEPIRTALPVPPVVSGGTAKAALEPAPETYGRAAAWQIAVPDGIFTTQGLSNVYLSICYSGDVGRLFSGLDLIDDNFFNGLAWRVGMRNVAVDSERPLILTVLPLRADAPIYLDSRYDPRPTTSGQVARVDHISWMPEYEVVISTG